MQTSIRSCFEEIFYEDYQKDVLQEQILGSNVQLVVKSEFFKMNPSTGKYVLEPLNWAWMGFVKGGQSALENQIITEGTEDGQSTV